MQNKNISTGVRKRFLSAALALLVVACGGGGSEPAPVSAGDETISAPPAPVSQTARVTVLLTDAPSDEFADINVTVTGIELLGGPERVVLFEGSQAVNILALENFSDLFSVAEDVPPGRYSKIRLYISDLELVREDDNGNVIETIYPSLPANGKLDLNPRGEFDVEAGENIVLQLDMDARRSIHIVGNGNGRYRFRPVIFVDVLKDESDGKVARVAGDIVAIDEALSRFELCQDSPSSATRADGDKDNDKDKDKDDDSDGGSAPVCVAVQVSDQTGLFDSDTASIAFADLMVGDQVTAIGRFSDADISDAVLLEAQVVARGAEGTFERFEGTVLSSADANNQFEFEFAPGQGFADGSRVQVALLPGTGIVDDSGVGVASDQIQPDTTAEIEGLLILSSIEPDALRAIFVVLDLGDSGPGIDEDRISGVVLSVDESSMSLALATDEGDRCVNLMDDSRVFLITVTDDASATDPIALADVPSGSQADLYGVESTDGCFAASIALVFAP